MSEPSPTNKSELQVLIAAAIPNSPHNLTEDMVVMSTSGKAVTQAMVAMADAGSGWKTLGSILGVAIGFIPEVGPVLGALFVQVWNLFDPNNPSSGGKGLEELLVELHDKIINEVKDLIQKNNVKQWIAQATTKLKGIQTVGNEFNKAYATWKANPNNTSNQNQLRTEFTYLKDRLLELESVYWEHPQYLAGMGCIITTMLFTLLRDVYNEGEKWGYGQAQIKDFRSTLAEQQLKVLKALQTGDCMDCTEACLYYRYVDPEAPWASGKKITVHKDFDPNKAYSADEVHVFSVLSLFNPSSLKEEIYWTKNNGGLHITNYIPTSTTQSTATITFDRDRTFQIRTPPMGGGGRFNINQFPYSPEARPRDPIFDDSLFPPTPTGNKKITIGIYLDDKNDSPYFSDFVMVPV